MRHAPAPGALFGPTAPFWFATLLVAANLVSVLLYFPETFRAAV